MIEPGETPAAAAVREAYEEAGVAVVAHSEIARRVHPRTKYLVVDIDCTTDVPTTAVVRSPRELAEVWCVDPEGLEGLMPDLFGPVRDRLRERGRPSYGPPL